MRRLAFASIAALMAAALASCAPPIPPTPQGSTTLTAVPTATVPPSGRSLTMKVVSSAFSDGSRLPKVYASARAGGEDRSIPVEWTDVPTGTASFAVTIVDHAPVARDWIHWAVVDLPPTTTSLPEGVSGRIPAPARELTNTRGTVGYGGPNPPPGSGDHPYEVTVYALSVTKLDVPEKPTAAQIQRAVQGKVLASGSITGTYSQ